MVCINNDLSVEFLSITMRRDRVYKNNAILKELQIIPAQRGKPEILENHRSSSPFSLMSTSE